MSTKERSKVRRVRQSKLFPPSSPFPPPTVFPRFLGESFHCPAAAACLIASSNSTVTSMLLFNIISDFPVVSSTSIRLISVLPNASTKSC
jgi:hypothetical protein